MEENKFNLVEVCMLFNEFLNGREETEELISEFKNSQEYKELVSYLELTRKIYNK
jgi:hypothetical protein